MIQSADQAITGGDSILAPILAALLFGGFAIYQGYRAYRPLRMIGPLVRTPRSDPNAVPEGNSWISGTVEWKDHTLEAPLTGTECVAYTVDGESLESGRRRTWWEDFTGKTAVAPFYVKGAVGRVLVTPTRLGARAVEVGAGEDEIGTVATEMALDWDDGDYRSDEDIFDLTQDHESYVDRDEEVPAVVETALAAHDALRYPDELTDRPVRFREWVLEPGDDVHVLGQVRDSSGASPVLTDDGVFVVSDTSPRATVFKHLSLAGRHLAIMLLALFPVALIVSGLLSLAVPGVLVAGGLFLGFLGLFAAASIGRMLTFPGGEYRQRRIKRLCAAGAIGVGTGLLGFVGLAGWGVTRLRGAGYALREILQGLDSSVILGFLLAAAGFVLPIALLIGAIAYAAFAILGWPADA